jgi:hypothetical protein
MDRRSWPWKKKSSDKSSAGDVLKSSGQAEQVCVHSLAFLPCNLDQLIC